MWLAKPLQILTLALLVFSSAATIRGTLTPALRLAGGAAASAGAASAWAPAPPGEREPALAPGLPGPGRAAGQVVAEAPPSIGERRARAVAMTVFSLGAVIGAGALVGFLIKRLL